MGKRKKKAADRKSNVLRVMLTEKDRAAIDAAAQAHGLETSTWVRLKILELLQKKK